MRADQSDRIAKPRRASPVVTVLVLGSLAGLVAAIYFTGGGQVPGVEELRALAPPVANRPVASIEAPATRGQVQRGAEVVPEAAQPVPELNPVALPPLDNSDAPVKSAVVEVAGEAGSTLEKQLVPEQVLRRSVVFVSALAEGKVERKASPLAAPVGAFREADGYIAPESYARYDAPIKLVTEVPPERVAAMYRRYYPLLQAACDELGERKRFHAVLLRAIDVLLAAPELVAEPAIEPSKGNLFRFSDPVLEALPPAHKQMLRLGRENEQSLKVWLRQLRAAVVATTKP